MSAFGDTIIYDSLFLGTNASITAGTINIGNQIMNPTALRISEGTWTPTLTNHIVSSGTTSNVSSYLSTKEGHYYRYGNLALIGYKLIFNASPTSAAGDWITIGGFPFTIVSECNPLGDYFYNNRSGRVYTNGYITSGGIIRRSKARATNNVNNANLLDVQNGTIWEGVFLARVS